MISLSWSKMVIKYKLSLVIMGMIAATWLVYSSLLLPQRDSIDQLTMQLYTERQQVKFIEEFLLIHPNPEQYMLELDKNLMQINRILPDDPESSSFVMQVEELSKECSMELNYLKPTKIMNKDGYREYEVEISLIGGFIESMQFIKKIENNSRFTNVIMVTMLPSKNRLETKLLVKIYSYGLPYLANKNSGITD
ncbi:type IV pilus inner membrane component PilO [Pelosinus propionicus]|uniref:Type IV pilus assembly protein PilO n=1 Tax=Pelosinus propionicus DSM 13327 TaxID=1123291 RepID=A0A1I4HD78_9FIRM|nr:type 4a pilus biogenesis protein PilO [Pelosinus propionicus]SFL40134.1 type IV pilus assembly protein PilO [Pelosinus propionicus DSM 13327]